MLSEGILSWLDIYGVLVQHCSEEAGRIIAVEVDIGMALQTTLMLPAGVRKPVSFRTVARGAHREAFVLEQKPIFQHVQEPLHSPVTRRNQGSGTD